ncbi:MAG TPA: hypothetical protein VHN80_23935, partial [Kineosporiaceae bacterium]|nr:hypothetical protein [Kineosporiaceae bacterium]
GIAVLALLSALDIFWVALVAAGGVGQDDAPPAAALAVFAVLGVVGLAAAWRARTGNRAAARVLVGSRVVSVVFVDLTPLLFDAPAWVKAVTAAAIFLTALGIWWTAPLLGRTGAARASARAAS